MPAVISQRIWQWIGLAALGVMLAGCGRATAATAGQPNPSTDPLPMVELTADPTAATGTPLPTASAMPLPTATDAPRAAVPSDSPVANDSSPPPDLNAGIVFAEHGDRSLPQVAITVDDFLTDDVLYWWMFDYLDENPDVKLTLFPVGHRVPEIESWRPGIWRAWLDAGHEIGFHSMYHDELSGLSAEDLAAEVATFNQVVGEVVGDPDFRVRWARATYGSYGPDRATFEQVAAEMGLTWVNWSVIPANTTYDGYLHGMSSPEAVQNGDVALFHVRWIDQYWIEQYVAECRTRGVEMVTLSGLKLVEEER